LLKELERVHLAETLGGAEVSSLGWRKALSIRSKMTEIMMGVEIKKAADRPPG